MKSLKKILAITLSLIMALGIMSVSAFAEDESADVISVIDVAVAEPVEGDVVTGAFAIEGLEYHLTFIQWSEWASGTVLYSSAKDFEVTDRHFEAGHSYVVCLTVKAGDGYVFDSAENLTAYVNNNEAQIANVSEDGKEVSFTYIFDCTVDEGDEGDEGFGSNFDTEQLLELLKTILLTFVRFIGSLLGLG